MSGSDGNGAQPAAQPAAEPAAPEPPPPPEPAQPAASEVGDVTARSAITGRHHERVDDMPHLEHARQLNEHRARKTELNLRRVFGYLLLCVLVLQIATADVVFAIYAAKNDWRIDGATMQVWLGAVVVQVVGLVWVVVKYLFSPDAAPR